jgi:hypothetical protein
MLATVPKGRAKPNDKTETSYVISTSSEFVGLWPHLPCFMPLELSPCSRLTEWKTDIRSLIQYKCYFTTTIQRTVTTNPVIYVSSEKMMNNINTVERKQLYSLFYRKPIRVFFMLRTFTILKRKQCLCLKHESTTVAPHFVMSTCWSPYGRIAQLGHQHNWPHNAKVLYGRIA